MTLDTNVVHIDLNYLIPDGFESAPKSVTVRDARRMPKESWQTLGFELFHFPSVVRKPNMFDIDSSPIPEESAEFAFDVVFQSSNIDWKFEIENIIGE